LIARCAAAFIDRARVAVCIRRGPIICPQQNLRGMNSFEVSSVLYLHLAGGALRGDHLWLRSVDARE
jgi:hypothetical protein